MKRQRLEIHWFMAAIMLIAAIPTHACIWDSDTLESEIKKSPEIAKIILERPAKPDPKPLRERIEKLKATPKESDPAWWNDLAGAHIRLGEAAEAVALLEPLRERFPNDYGIHANLGTAYHLLGRFAEAEKEIARDLELNPEAHFGLEKYHLALLQYLSRDADYQADHVYVDEWSETFLNTKSRPDDFWRTPFTTDPLPEDAPAYRKQWDLADNTNFLSGVTYMATLNPDQPACFVMLGIACLNQYGYRADLNLSIKAFERAVALKSPQADILQQHITEISNHIVEATINNPPRTMGVVPLRMETFMLLFVGIPLLLAVCFAIWAVISKRRSQASASSHAAKN